MPEIITVARRILVFKSFEIAGEIDDLNDPATTYEQVSQQIGHYLA
jgi:ribose transport system ATP-binding protein